MDIVRSACRGGFARSIVVYVSLPRGKVGAVAEDYQLGDHGAGNTSYALHWHGRRDIHAYEHGPGLIRGAGYFCSWKLRRNSRNFGHPGHSAFDVACGPEILCASTRTGHE